MIEQTEKQHALLSASTAHRWLVCTPSAVLEREEEVGECSVFAAEGTAAHTLAELKLSHLFGRLTDSEYASKFEEFKTNEATGAFYNKTFEEYVDSYVDFVKTQKEELGEGTTVDFEGASRFLAYRSRWFWHSRCDSCKSKNWGRSRHRLEVWSGSPGDCER